MSKSLLKNINIYSSNCNDFLSSLSKKDTRDISHALEIANILFQKKYPSEVKHLSEAIRFAFSLQWPDIQELNFYTKNNRLEFKTKEKNYIIEISNKINDAIKMEIGNYHSHDEIPGQITINELDDFQLM